MTELNLNAYYYSFEPTGNEVIDIILSQVAQQAADYIEVLSRKATAFDWYMENFGDISALGDGDGIELIHGFKSYFSPTLLEALEQAMEKDHA